MTFCYILTWKGGGKISSGSLFITSVRLGLASHKHCFHLFLQASQDGLFFQHLLLCVCFPSGELGYNAEAALWDGHRAPASDQLRLPSEWFLRRCGRPGHHEQPAGRDQRGQIGRVVWNFLSILQDAEGRWERGKCGQRPTSRRSSESISAHVPFCNVAPRTLDAHVWTGVLECSAVSMVIKKNAQSLESELLRSEWWLALICNS